MFINRLRSNRSNRKELHKSEEREKNWDQRFVLYKIPPYDAFKDSNYLSLGLMKSKIKYERFLIKEKQRKLKGKNTYFTEHYVIDSHKGNQTTKDKSKKKLFSAKDNQNENYEIKNNLAKTYSIKFNKTKSSLSNSGNNLTVEEMDLLDEFDIIKVLWNKFGVTKEYQESFTEFINSLDNVDNIRTFLNLEKIQMQKFKYELTQLVKKIIHRNDQILQLKQLINLYEDILKEKKNNPEKSNANLDTLSNINEKQVISDIHSCLLSLRISTINVVNQIKNFSISNSYYLYMNKINLNKIKNDYSFSYEYLISIKSDLDFIQNSILTNLYDFDNYDGCDPFFISFSKIKEEGEQNPEEKKKNKKLDISKKMFDEIKNCVYFLQQAEILNKCKYSNKSNTHKNKVLQFLKSGYTNEENNKKKRYGIGNLFKGNLEQDIIKLKAKKEYNGIFNFISTSSAHSNEKIKGNKLKKSSKNKHNIPLMTSQELKKKFSQYDLLNELINEPNNENQNEEEFKKRDKVINILNFQKEEEEEKKDEEKKEESEHNGYDNEFKEDDNKDKKAEEKENKQESIKFNESIEKKENKEESKENNEELEKKEENKDLENNKEEDNKEEDENKKEESIKDKKLEESKIDEDIPDINQKENNEVNEPKSEEKIPSYITSFYTETLDKLTFLYNDYLLSDPTIYTCNTPNKSKDFLCGIYPKIIIAKKDGVTEDKIYGICGTNFYIDEDKEYILKINHLSVNDNNKDILDKILELVEKENKYKIIEIDLKKEMNTEEEKNALLDILESKGFKEYYNNDDKIIMRKENINNELNDSINEIGSQINYDSLGVLSLINKEENKETQNEKYKLFDKVINPINLSLLIDKLKTNEKYKVDILSQSPKTSLLENLDNKFFDFIKSQNNECLNINEITNNEIIPKEGFYYSILNNQLKIQINTLMTLKIENYLYNGIEINIKNNLIKEPKYNNDLYCLPTINQNVFIIIYPYNEVFEKEISKYNTNIYELFISSFKLYIKNNIFETKIDDDNSNKKFLWIPAFNINTNLFTSDLGMNQLINIKNNEDKDIEIKEYNEFLKINYLPDCNKDKNMDINLKEGENDIIIRDKFIMGICHKEFMENFDIPIISLINITKDNFAKVK